MVRFALLLGIVCGAFAAPAHAQEKYPTRPIKFVVGFLAGGPNDIVARIFCDFLTAASRRALRGREPRPARAACSPRSR